MNRTIVFGLIFCCLIANHSFAKTIRLVSKDADQQNYEKHIRSTNNAYLISLLPSMVFYSKTEIPSYFQIDEYNSDFIGFMNTPRNIFAEPNKFFPWILPGGLIEGSNSTSFKFVVFPEPQGATRTDEEKIQWWKEMVAPAQFNRSLGGIHRWQYPVGTIFGEVLLVSDPEGRARTFEVRTRTKTHAIFEGGWDMEAYKPFPTSKKLLKRLEQMHTSEPWNADPTVANLISHLTNKDRFQVKTLQDASNNLKATFGKRTALIDELPAIPAELVNELLTTTPFEKATGEFWEEKDGVAAANPSTRSTYHIVPRNTHLPFMFVDNDSCMSCHDSVQHHTREFSRNAPNGKDWYGYVRGSDAIFTFHFMSSTGSGNNFRRAFVDADLLTQMIPENLVLARAEATRKAEEAQAIAKAKAEALARERALSHTPSTSPSYSTGNPTGRGLFRNRGRR